MSMDIFNRIADEAQGFVKHVYLHLWGEPTLNKHLPEMIRRVKDFATIDLATHGLTVDEALADAIAQCSVISVSIDGVDQAVYEQYRVGGKLEHALRGLRLLKERARPGTLRWTFVVFKQNEHQMGIAQQMADQIGVPIQFKSPAFWDRTRMDENMPTTDEYRRFTYSDGEWKLKADRLKCREFWETVYVLPNGDVVTCCYDGAAHSIVGNVNGSSLLEVWYGPAYQAMRDSHSGGHLNEMCLKYCQLAG
jgi:MoaA/NifB/PqqE/SkfB family radical SAM enzyme